MDAVRSVVDSGWFVLGPRVREFEKDFAEFVGAGDCIGVGNGTDAIELALRATGVAPGSEVVTVANAGGYASAAIRSIGATPVYVDVDPETLLVSPEAVRGTLGEATAAIVVTHLYGRVAPVDQIVGIAGDRAVPVIEDCAQAHGATVGGAHVGTVGTLGCFSFYPTKNLGALGDAGAIVGDDQDLMGHVRRLRQYGWSQKYHRTEPGGRNSRLDELQAAVLSALLPNLDEWNRRRCEIGLAYRDGISHPDIRHVPIRDGDVVHLAVVETGRRQSLEAHLGGLGIATDVHYPAPDHAGSETRLPVTETACESVLTLPCFPEMIDAEIEMVIEGVGSWRP